MNAIKYNIIVRLCTNWICSNYTKKKAWQRYEECGSHKLRL